MIAHSGHEVHPVAITTLVLIIIVCRSWNSCIRGDRLLAGYVGRGIRAATANKIEPWVIEHTANGQQAEFMVVLADQADLSPAAALATKNEKSRYVYDTLWNKSQATQGPILQWLRERGLEYRSFYIVNAILVKGSREIAETLAARPDVARVEGNPQIHNVASSTESCG